MPVDLPHELAAGMRAAKRVEDAANRQAQHRAAVAATNRLMLAAFEVGWSTVAMARVLEIDPNAARARLKRARLLRAVSDDRATGLEVPPAERAEPRRASTTAPPLATREWLSMSEASALTGSPVRTIASWREVGLLPNTDRRDPHCFWYLRADLERVARADRYRDGAVRRMRLLEQIRDATA